MLVAFNNGNLIQEAIIMDRLKILIIIILAATISSCGILPFKESVKDDHFRFENFKRNITSKEIYVHLMCYRKQPVGWAQPKQYLAGQHVMWVKAMTQDRNFPSSTKYAFAKFAVNLQAGKSYMLNRKLDGSSISMWIQEIETGIHASNIIVTQLKTPLLVEDKRRLDQCRSGTI